MIGSELVFLLGSGLELRLDRPSGFAIVSFAKNTICPFCLIHQVGGQTSGKAKGAILN